MAIANSPSAIEQEIQTWLDEQGTPVFSNVSSATQTLHTLKAQAPQRAQPLARTSQRKPLAVRKQDAAMLASLLSRPNQDCQNAKTQEHAESQIEMREQSDGTLSFSNVAPGLDQPPSSRIACPKTPTSLALPRPAATQLLASLDPGSSQSSASLEKNPAEHDALEDH